MWKIGVNFSLKIHGIMCTSKKYIDGKSLLWKGKTCYKLVFREKLLEWFVSAGNHSVCWQLGYTKHIAISQHHQLNFGSNSKTTSRAESQHPTHLNPQRFSRKQSLQSRTNSTCFPFFFFPPTSPSLPGSYSHCPNSLGINSLGVPEKPNLVRVLNTPRQPGRNGFPT